MSLECLGEVSDKEIDMIIINIQIVFKINISEVIKRGCKKKWDLRQI